MIGKAKQPFLHSGYQHKVSFMEEYKNQLIMRLSIMAILVFAIHAGYAFYSQGEIAFFSVAMMMLMVALFFHAKYYKEGE